jgi:hypothetical protein
MQLTFPISLFTNRTRTPLSKNISLDAAGSLVKQTGGLLTSGQVETLGCTLSKSWRLPLPHFRLTRLQDSESVVSLKLQC